MANIGESYDSILTIMEEKYEQLAGVAPVDASDIGIRLKIVAEQIWQMRQSVDRAEKNAFPQTAGGHWLELHAAQRGLQRKPPLPAIGTVTFSRSAASTTEVVIEPGIVVASKGEDGQRYVTTLRTVLLSGQLSVDVPVKCLVLGKMGNMAAGMVSVMVSPVQGMTQVINAKPITGGEDQENDSMLRQRLLDSYLHLTNGTNEAFYHQLAMKYSGISSAKVIPRINGRGTVGIFVYGQGANSQTIQQIKSEISSIKELNVDLVVEKAVERNVPIELEIAVGAAYSFEDTAELCKERIEYLLEKQKVGDSLPVALLIREALECGGVANCRVMKPGADVYPLEKERIISSSVVVKRMQIQA